MILFQTATHSVTLTWENNAQACNVIILRSHLIGLEKPWTMTAINKTTWTDTAVIAGDEYCYVVEAACGGWKGVRSLPSNEVCVGVPLP